LFLFISRLFNTYLSVLFIRPSVRSFVSPSCVSHCAVRVRYYSWNCSMAGTADCACFSLPSIRNTSNKVNIAQSCMHLLLFPITKHRISFAARHKNVNKNANSIAKYRKHFTNIVHIFIFFGEGGYWVLYLLWQNMRTATHNVSCFMSLLASSVHICSLI
jgi:hypothetical protein